MHRSGIDPEPAGDLEFAQDDKTRVTEGSIPMGLVQQEVEAVSVPAREESWGAS